MAMYAAGIAGLCLSSSLAAAFAMNKKDEEVAVPAEQPEETIEKEEVEETGIAPEQPPPPPSEPEQKQLTTPNSMRSASGVWGERGLNFKLETCGNSMIDSKGAWCANPSVIGSWIQLDNGKVGSISGVITQGRKDADQWVKSFKVKYKDKSGSWWDIDGKTFPGNKDRNTKVTTTFSKPVMTRYIRIYPQSRNGHMSMRVDMIGGSTNTTDVSALGDLPYSNHSSSANWGGDAIGTSHGAGRLDSGRAWSATAAEQANKEAWYQLSVDNPINVSGVAMKGRPDTAQWITSVKIQYEDENGELKDVDGGFVFDANYDKNSLVKILFENPVRTKAIRFYPQTWKSHASGRFGIFRGGEVSSTEKYQIMGYTFE
jgi:hypothetical protein